MDPTANLAEQRRLVEELHHGNLSEMDAADAGRRLADLVKALDEWLSGWGFLPAAWKGAK